jgi:hypothetical protein
MSANDKQIDWKKIPWATDYEVSSNGKVASWKPIRNFAKKPTEKRFLKPSKDKDGYFRVVIRDNNNKKRYLRVCRLVAEVWHGVPPKGFVVRHLDGNNQNDNIENLKWGTPKENSQDAIKHGTVRKGSSINTSKLNEYQVIEALQSNESHSFLARKFNVTPGAIWHIRQRRTWKHVSP